MPGCHLYRLRDVPLLRIFQPAKCWVITLPDFKNSTGINVLHSVGITLNAKSYKIYRQATENDDPLAISWFRSDLVGSYIIKMKNIKGETDTN